MRRNLIIALLILAGISPDTARAGAWTLDQDQMQIITGVTISGASRRFGESGAPKEKGTFSQLFLQTSAEYGATEGVTLFMASEFALAHWQFDDGMAANQRNAAIEGGARWRLFADMGVLSIQGSAKVGGISAAYSAGISNAGSPSSWQGELRLLYGTSYQLFGDDGFADLQIAEHWISRPRPDEMKIEATAGLWLTPETLVMLKSYNIVSEGAGEAPYTHYRQHKLELSLVRRITDVWSLQLGAFVSPAGQNIVAEQGIVTSIWAQF